MKILYGQFPIGGYISGQYVAHSMAGSIADAVTLPPNSGGGAYIRRSNISSNIPEYEEDIILALATFLILQESF